jgi:type IV fimbrial biogenesis protein FimT
MNSSSKKNKNQGFTLIELLVTCTLSAVLIVLAISGYHYFITADRSLAQVTQLVTAIQFARSEAIKRHTTVTLCKSADQKQCGGVWSNGWIIFVDTAGGGKVISKNSILRVYQIPSHQCTLKWEASRSDNYLQMSASGETRGQDGSFIYCSLLNKSHPGYSIIVSQTGRVRVVKGEDADGKPLICIGHP